MPSVLSVPEKPWSISDFRAQRPHLVNFCDTQIVPHTRRTMCSRILIRAPVKSGKREIAEYLALLDQTSPNRIVHVFLSAWHRIADDEQRKELETHNLKVFSINTKTNRDKCLEFMQQQIRAGRELRVHIDECDHGTGSRQLLSPIWRYIRDRDDVKAILYSATPEEASLSADFSDENDADFNEMIGEFEDENVSVIVKYEPTAQFCGPAKFLSEGLVSNATPAYYTIGGSVQLTPQFKRIISDLRASLLNPLNRGRNIIILRLSSGGKTKANRAIHIFTQHLSEFPELNGFHKCVDKDDGTGGANEEKIQWSNKVWWNRQTKDDPILIVHDQTSSRSTEWACHDRVFATHDYREAVTYTTVSQAQERANHYTGSKYPLFQSIRVYGHLPSFQLSAGQIDYTTYMTLTHKIKKITVSGADVFRIVEISTDRVIVPYAEYTNKRDAEYKLMEMGSYVKPTLSQRVKGSAKETVVCESGFIPCNAETFDSIAKPAMRIVLGDDTRVIHNPFDSTKMTDDGKYMGVLRSEWRVFDYDEDIKDSAYGFFIRDIIARKIRHTVCYKNGVEGIGWRIPVSTRPKNTLATKGSMYPEAV